MNTIRLTIDGRAVEVESGQTLLAAARKLGIDVPTLCHHEKCTPSTSCLVCLVKVKANGAGRLVPSCATRAEPGMMVESEVADVFEARRTALELLFSDHVGDCLSPCHRICPLQLNIPAMLRQVDAGQTAEAVATVRKAIPLAGITGWLCSAPCEQGCRRGTHDAPAAIRDVERFVAGQDVSWQPPCAADSGKSVAIVGAGPTGLMAAHELRLKGHAVTVLDRRAEPGGSLWAEIEAGNLPSGTLHAEVDRLRAMGVVFRSATPLGDSVTLEQLVADHAAVLLAVGERGKAQAQGWGLTLVPTGIKVAADTSLTNLGRVFAAGSAVKSMRQVVRAMAEGRTAATAIHQFLSGQVIQRLPKPFSSIMGKTSPEEVAKFMIGPSPIGRTVPTGGATAGFAPTEARVEASRCLHCDCRSEGSCALQRYAEMYDVDTSRFRGERRPFEQHLEHGHIIFEPGKCILCGICVQLAEQAREPLGLAFIGRGFDVKVGVPFSREIDEGLQKVGKECVEACPTGALVFKDDFLKQMKPFSATGRCGR